MAILKRVLLALWMTLLIGAWLVGPAGCILLRARSPVAWGCGLVAGALIALGAFWYRGRWRVSARWPNFPFEILAPFSILGGVVGLEVLLWLGVKALLR